VPRPTPRAADTLAFAGSHGDTPFRADGAAPLRARLTIGARPQAEVEIDGRPFGRAPLAEVTMEPGEHEIELVHPDFWPRRKRVVLFPGSLLQLDVDLAWEGVRRTSAAPYRLPGSRTGDPGLGRAVDLITEMEWHEAVAALETVVGRLKAQPARRRELARAHFYLGTRTWSWESRRVRPRASRPRSSMTPSSGRQRRRSRPAS
jgi:hypothetical protein